MSDTYILKQDSKYSVYNDFGGFVFPQYIQQAAANKGKSVFDLMMGLFSPLYGYEPVAVVNENEATIIADATNTLGKEPGHHRFAGDNVYLVDADNEVAYYRKRARMTGGSFGSVQTWEEM